VNIRALLAREQVRFLIVGGINTAVGYGFFALFLLFSGYLASLYLSYAVAVSVAFVLHRRFTFRVSGNVAVDFVRFVGVYVISLAINTAVLPLLVEAVGLHALVAQAIALVITTVISYVGHKWFSFRRAVGGGSSGVAAAGSLAGSATAAASPRAASPPAASLAASPTVPTPAAASPLVSPTVPAPAAASLPASLPASPRASPAVPTPAAASPPPQGSPLPNHPETRPPPP